jgi:hypothetical protein
MMKGKPDNNIRSACDMHPGPIFFYNSARAQNIMEQKNPLSVAGFFIDIPQI